MGVGENASACKSMNRRCHLAPTVTKNKLHVNRNPFWDPPDFLFNQSSDKNTWLCEGCVWWTTPSVRNDCRKENDPINLGLNLLHLASSRGSEPANRTAKASNVLIR